MAALKGKGTQKEARLERLKAEIAHTLKIDQVALQPILSPIFQTSERCEIMDLQPERLVILFRDT